MKKHIILISAALMLAAPAVAGDGGQAVSEATKALKDAGTNLGQAIKAVREVNPDFKLGPVVSDLNK